MFNKILKKLMTEKNISNYRLAKEIGVSNSTIANWLNGVSRPNDEKLQKLADYFDVSVDYLIGRTNNEKDISNQEIAKKISAISKEKGITLSFICAKIGARRQFFADVKSGNSSISPDRLAQIAEILGTTPEYLCGETDIKEKPAENGELSEDDIKLIKICHQLPPEFQRAISRLDELSPSQQQALKAVLLSYFSE